MRKDPTKKGNRQELLNGPIMKTLVILAWPVVLSMMLQTVYNLADTIWVGRLGPAAVAAISVSFPLVFLFISMGSGFTMAGTTLVAQYIGAGKDDEADHVASQTVGFIAGVSIVLAAVGYLAAPYLLQMLGADQGVFNDALGFIRIWFLGLPFIFLFFAFQALVRGFGDTISAMKLMIASVVLNVVLDPFLIYGWWIFPKMGVPGAALATTTARVTVGIVGIYILFSGSLGLQIHLSEMWPTYRTIRKIVNLGVPNAAGNSMRAIGMIAMTATVAVFGTPALAAYGIGNRVMSVVFMPSMGLGAATTTMVGQNLGGGHEDRAERTTWYGAALVFVVLMVAGLVAFFFPQLPVNAFLQTHGVAYNQAVFYVRTIALTFGFVGVFNVMLGAYRGAGRMVTSMIFSALSLLVLRLPLAYGLSLPLNMGMSGLWWGVAIANVVGAVVAAIWFTRGHWKGSVIEDEDEQEPARRFGKQSEREERYREIPEAGA